MSIIREKIKYIPVFGTGLTTNIHFGISAEDGFLGLQQEIDNLTQVVGIDLVNPDLDVEERKVKYIPNIGPLTLQFNFHTTGNNWLNSFVLTSAGFTPTQLAQKSSNVLNSFFILDFYDTYDINTQVKIFTTYLTKIGTGPGYTIDAGVANQFYYWYVPIWYLDSFSGATITTGYTKFSFYNATTGKVQLFFNSDYEALIGTDVNPLQMYFPTQINLLNKTWKIITPPSHANLVIAKELWNSPAFSDKVDNTVGNFNNEAQDYPSGNTFNYIDGKYETI